MTAQHSYKLRYENGDGWVALIYRGDKLVTRLEYFDRGREAGDAARDWIDQRNDDDADANNQRGAAKYG